LYLEIKEIALKAIQQDCTSDMNHALMEVHSSSSKKSETNLSLSCCNSSLSVPLISTSLQYYSYHLSLWLSYDTIMTFVLSKEQDFFPSAQHKPNLDA